MSDPGAATATLDPTRPGLATFALDAYNLSPLAAAEDAATLLKHLWQLIVPRVVAATTAYLGPSGAYADGKHHGIDLAAALGAPILAPLAGTIVAGPAGYDGPNTLGNGIYERLDDGTLLVFGHSIAGPAVALGTRVAAGQQIGSVGSSGNSTGPHVHFQVLPPGVTNPLRDVDPIAWIRAHVPTVQLPGQPPPAPAPVPTPPSSPAPAPAPGPGAIPGQPPAPGTHADPGPGQTPAGDLPDYRATVAELGPFKLQLDLSWLLRLLLSLVAVWLIVYGLMKLSGVEATAKELAGAVADAAVPG